MHEHPVVSVVMAVYQPHPAYFREAVRSVLEQTYDDIELIVVEDPSSTPAADVLRQFPDSRIRHVVNPVRTSLVPSRNQALGLARGQFVAMLDADDVCRPDRIQKQVAYFEAHEEACVVGTQLELIDSSGRCRGWRRYPLDHRSIVRAMARFNSIAQPSAMLRRRTAVALGECFYADCETEDYDLWCRLARKGARFANLPEALVQYRIHPDARKAQTLRQTLRGTIDVKRKYWNSDMGPADRLRMYAEYLMLMLPPSFVYRLFILVQCRSAGNGRDGACDRQA